MYIRRPSDTSRRASILIKELFPLSSFISTRSVFSLFSLIALWNRCPCNLGQSLSHPFFFQATATIYPLILPLPLSSLSGRQSYLAATNLATQSDVIFALRFRCLEPQTGRYHAAPSKFVGSETQISVSRRKAALSSSIAYSLCLLLPSIQPLPAREHPRRPSYINDGRPRVTETANEKLRANCSCPHAVTCVNAES
jgi:hypothetical protein